MFNATNFDYYEFRENYVRDTIIEEINFFSKSPYINYTDISDYTNYLKNRIGLDKQSYASMTRYNGLGQKCEIKKMNLDEHVKDLDMLMFKKPWSKVRPYHKIMKIREFIEKLPYKKPIKPERIAKNKEFLKNEICEGLKTKKFVKNKSEIIYDPDKMSISSIDCLTYSKKKGIYNIEWN